MAGAPSILITTAAMCRQPSYLFAAMDPLRPDVALSLLGHRGASLAREWNERLYELIAAFHGLTGIPLVLNTSFNIMGKPIIHSVEEALGLFIRPGWMGS